MVGLNTIIRRNRNYCIAIIIDANIIEEAKKSDLASNELHKYC